MVDISKCEGRDCPLKESCLRYTCKADQYLQSYLTESPYKDGECNYFIQDRKVKNEK